MISRVSPIASGTLHTRGFKPTIDKEELPADREIPEDVEEILDGGTVWYAVYVRGIDIWFSNATTKTPETTGSIAQGFCIDFGDVDVSGDIINSLIAKTNRFDFSLKNKDTGFIGEDIDLYIGSGSEIDQPNGFLVFSGKIDNITGDSNNFKYTCYGYSKYENQTVGVKSDDIKDGAIYPINYGVFIDDNAYFKTAENTDSSVIIDSETNVQSDLLFSGSDGDDDYFFGSYSDSTSVIPSSSVASTATALDITDTTAGVKTYRLTVSADCGEPPLKIKTSGGMVFQAWQKSGLYYYGKPLSSNTALGACNIIDQSWEKKVFDISLVRQAGIRDVDIVKVSGTSVDSYLANDYNGLTLIENTGGLSFTTAYDLKMTIDLPNIKLSGDIIELKFGAPTGRMVVNNTTDSTPSGWTILNTISAYIKDYTYYLQGASTNEIIIQRTNRRSNNVPLRPSRSENPYDITSLLTDLSAENLSSQTVQLIIYGKIIGGYIFAEDRSEEYPPSSYYARAFKSVFYSTTQTFTLYIKVNADVSENDIYNRGVGRYINSQIDNNPMRILNDINLNEITTDLNTNLTTFAQRTGGIGLGMQITEQTQYYDIVKEVCKTCYTMQTEYPNKEIKFVDFEYESTNVEITDGMITLKNRQADISVQETDAKDLITGLNVKYAYNNKLKRYGKERLYDGAVFSSYSTAKTLRGGVDNVLDIELPYIRDEGSVYEIARRYSRARAKVLKRITITLDLNGVRFWCYSKIKFNSVIYSELNGVYIVEQWRLNPTDSTVRCVLCEVPEN